MIPISGQKHCRTPPGQLVLRGCVCDAPCHQVPARARGPASPPDHLPQHLVLLAEQGGSYSRSTGNVDLNDLFGEAARRRSLTPSGALRARVCAQGKAGCRRAHARQCLRRRTGRGQAPHRQPLPVRVPARGVAHRRCEPAARSGEHHLRPALNTPPACAGAGPAAPGTSAPQEPGAPQALAAGWPGGCTAVGLR